MATTIERLENMQREAVEAAKKRAEFAANGGSTNPYVMRMQNTISLKPDERVLIRPLYNIHDIPFLVRYVHDQFKNFAPDGSSDPLNNICAEEYGKPCALCADGHTDKKERREEAFFPVALYRQEKEGFPGEWVEAPYVDKEGQVFPKRGFRLLRVKQSHPAFQQLMSVYRDKDYGNDITVCDFVIERRGATMNDTKYTCTTKPPKPMAQKMRDGMPSIADFEKLLLQCFPLRVVEHQSVNRHDDPLGGLDEDDMWDAGDVHATDGGAVRMMPASVPGAQENDFEFCV